MTIKKGLDGCFLQYGIRQEDMKIVERICEQDDVDADWMKEYFEDTWATQHTVSFQGANDRGSYFASVRMQMNFKSFTFKFHII